MQAVSINKGRSSSLNSGCSLNFICFRLLFCGNVKAKENVFKVCSDVSAFICTIWSVKANGHLLPFGVTNTRAFVFCPLYSFKSFPETDV